MQLTQKKKFYKRTKIKGTRREEFNGRNFDKSRLILEEIVAFSMCLYYTQCSLYSLNIAWKPGLPHSRNSPWTSHDLSAILQITFAVTQRYARCTERRLQRNLNIQFVQKRSLCLPCELLDLRICCGVWGNLSSLSLILLFFCKRLAYSIQ